MDTGAAGEHCANTSILSGNVDMTSGAGLNTLTIARGPGC